MDLASCASREFLRLTVWDATGAETMEAVWFAIDGDRIVTVLTNRHRADAIVEHPQVRIAFANARREIVSDAASAVARRLDSDEYRRVRELLNRKYGWRRRSFRFLFWFTRRLGSSWDAKDHVFEIRLS